MQSKQTHELAGYDLFVFRKVAALVLSGASTGDVWIMADKKSRNDRRVQVVLDGVEIIPSRLQVGYKGTPTGNLVTCLAIDKRMLVFELNEVGVDVDDDSILEFVKRDVDQNPKQAVSAYLGIIQAVAYPSAKKSFFQTLFSKKKKAECPVDVLLYEPLDVFERDGVIVIRVTAECR